MSAQSAVILGVRSWVRVPAAYFRENLKLLESVMAQVCKLCGKGPQFGNKISHAHNVSKRRWNVNLRPVKAEVPGGHKRIRVCTRCIKAGKVVKG
jgi:large subunit ribosomal protein L28